MTVSALVVTLSSDPAASARALSRLGADPRLSLGRVICDRLPLVAETADAAAGAALFEELERSDGVSRVDLVSVQLDAEVA